MPLKEQLEQILLGKNAKGADLPADTKAGDLLRAIINANQVDTTLKYLTPLNGSQSKLQTKRLLRNTLDTYTALPLFGLNADQNGNEVKITEQTLDEAKLVKTAEDELSNNLFMDLRRNYPQFKLSRKDKNAKQEEKSSSVYDGNDYKRDVLLLIYSLNLSPSLTLFLLGYIANDQSSLSEAGPITFIQNLESDHNLTLQTSRNEKYLKVISPDAIEIVELSSFYSLIPYPAPDIVSDANGKLPAILTHDIEKDAPLLQIVTTITISQPANSTDVKIERINYKVYFHNNLVFLSDIMSLMRNIFGSDSPKEITAEQIVKRLDQIDDYFSKNEREFIEYFLADHNLLSANSPQTFPQQETQIADRFMTFMIGLLEAFSKEGIKTDTHIIPNQIKFCYYIIGQIIEYNKNLNVADIIENYKKIPDALRGYFIRELFKKLGDEKPENVNKKAAIIKQLHSYPNKDGTRPISSYLNEVWQQLLRENFIIKAKTDKTPNANIIINGKMFTEKLNPELYEKVVKAEPNSKYIFHTVDDQTYRLHINPDNLELECFATSLQQALVGQVSPFFTVMRVILGELDSPKTIPVIIQSWPNPQELVEKPFSKEAYTQIQEKFDLNTLIRLMLGTALLRPYNSTPDHFIFDDSRLIKTTNTDLMYETNGNSETVLNSLSVLFCQKACYEFIEETNAIDEFLQLDIKRTIRQWLTYDLLPFANCLRQVFGTSPKLNFLSLQNSCIRALRASDYLKNIKNLKMRMHFYQLLAYLEGKTAADLYREVTPQIVPTGLTITPEDSHHSLVGSLPPKTAAKEKDFLDTNIHSRQVTRADGTPIIREGETVTETYIEVKDAFYAFSAKLSLAGAICGASTPTAMTDALLKLNVDFSDFTNPDGTPSLELQRLALDYLTIPQDGHYIRELTLENCNDVTRFLYQSLIQVFRNLYTFHITNIALTNPDFMIIAAHGRLLQKLFISKVTGLTSVYAKNGSLPNILEITISACASLKTFDLENDNIKTITIQDCPSLQSLNLNCTNLEKIIIKNCPKLTAKTIDFAVKIDGKIKNKTLPVLSITKNDEKREMRVVSYDEIFAKSKATTTVLGEEVCTVVTTCRKSGKGILHFNQISNINTFNINCITAFAAAHKVSLNLAKINSFDLSSKILQALRSNNLVTDFELQVSLDSNNFEEVAKMNVILESINLLIQHNHTLRAITLLSTTPLPEDVKQSFNEITQSLIANNANYLKMAQAIEDNNSKQIQDLLSENVSLLARDANGNTWLHQAVSLGKLKAVETFVTAMTAEGLPLDLPNNDYMTAFELAVERAKTANGESHDIANIMRKYAGNLRNSQSHTNSLLVQLFTSITSKLSFGSGPGTSPPNTPSLPTYTSSINH